MAKIKCDCQRGEHKTSGQRLKCRKSRGTIISNSGKRLDPVVLDQMLNPEKQVDQSEQEIDQRQDAGMFKLARDEPDSEGTYSNNVPPGQFRFQLQKIAPLRNNSFRCLDREYPCIDQKNFARQFKNQNKKLQRLDQKDSIIEKLHLQEEIIDKSGLLKNGSPIDNIDRKRVLNNFGDKKLEILQDMKRHYTNQTLIEVFQRFSQLNQFFSQQEKIKVRKRCEEEWEKYISDWDNAGSFGRLTSKYFLIEEVVENWSSLVQEDKEKREWALMNKYQRQIHLEKQELLKQFTELKLKSQEDEFLVKTWTFVANSETKQILGREYKPIVPHIRKGKYKRQVELDQFIDRIPQMFDEMYEYCRTGRYGSQRLRTDYHLKVFADFRIKLTQYHKFARKRMEDRVSIQSKIMEQQRERRRVQDEKKKATSNYKEPSIPSIIACEEDFHKLLDYGLYRKHILTKQNKNTSICCKLILIKPWKVVLIAQSVNRLVPYKSYEEVIRFKETEEIKSFLKTYLYPLPNAFWLIPKPTIYTGIPTAEMKQEEQGQHVKPYLHIPELTPESLKNQALILKEGTLIHQALKTINNILFFCWSRRQAVISIDDIVFNAKNSYSKSSHLIKLFLEAFPNLFRMTQNERYVYCSGLSDEAERQKKLNMMLFTLEKETKHF